VVIINHGQVAEFIEANGAIGEKARIKAASESDAALAAALVENGQCERPVEGSGDLKIGFGSDKPSPARADTNDTKWLKHLPSTTSQMRSVYRWRGQ
jgi:hypothetical protein